MKKLATHALALAALIVALPVTSQAAPPDPAEIQAAQEEAFVEADADGNGVLSLTEFSTFHEVMRAKMEENRFNDIDADGSGGLSLTEIEAARPPRGGGRQ